MKKISVNVILKLSIVLSVLMISFSISYYLLHLLPLKFKPQESRVNKSEPIDVVSEIDKPSQVDRWIRNQEYKNQTYGYQKDEEEGESKIRERELQIKEEELAQREREIQQQEAYSEQLKKQQQIQAIATVLDKTLGDYGRQKQQIQQEYDDNVQRMIEENRKSAQQIFENSRTRSTDTDCKVDNWGNIHCTSRQNPY